MFGYLNYEKLMTQSQEEYNSALPFKHAVIDGVADEEKLSQVLARFPDKQDKSWWKYSNDFEKKLAFDKVREMQTPIKELLIELNSPQFLEVLEKLTGIQGLIPDPYYRGGGCHQITRGGRLAIHADFNFNPKLKLYRRVNVLLYLNKGWDSNWKGQLELWNEDMKSCSVSIDPIFNRMVIFNSTETSWHGHPHELECPENISRKSVAVYFYSATPAEGALEAHSTKYQFLPGEEPTEEQKEFQKVRSKFRES